MPYFTHERLDVYRLAIRFVSLAEQMVDGVARGHGHVTDQLRRASTSIALNIAEGAGEFSPREKARFYRMARRSALECAAVLDVLETLGSRSTPEAIRAGHELLLQITGMLTRLVFTWERADRPSSHSDSRSNSAGRRENPKAEGELE